VTTSMLAQEHISYVNAVQYGDGSRTSATVQAAQNFIGSAFAVLLLAKTGNGIWTLNSNHIFASNIVVLIPPGVVLAGTGNLTFQCQVQAASGEGTWYAGTGILTFPPFAAVTYFNYIQARGIGLNTNAPQSQLHLSGDVPVPAAIIVEQRTLGAGNAGMVFRSAGLDRGFIGLQNSGGGNDIAIVPQGSGGNLIIGSAGGAKIGLNTLTAPQAQLHMTGNAALPAIMRLEESAPSAGGAIVSWWSAGTKRGELGIAATTQDITLQLSGSARYIVNGGNVGVGIIPTHLLQLSSGDAAMPGGGSWVNSTSDIRLKENVSLFTDGLAIALQLVPKWYEYNGLGETLHDGKRYVGFIAQDIEALLPYMVGHDTTRKLHPEDTDTADFLTLHEAALPHILLNAVKEQQALIQALTDRVAALEAKVP
jgi:hypothetical protein